jgi:hypothetical protein
MLPVKQTEKFAVLLLQCVIIIPLMLIAVPTLLNIIVSLTGDVPLTGIWASLKDFFYDIAFVFMLQAVGIWGVLFFRRRKLWKTILTLLCIVTGVSITMSIVTHIYFSASPEALPTDLMKLLPEKNIIIPIITALLWTWGFFKMRRQQL